MLAYGISEAGGTAGFGATSAWLPMTVGAIFVAGFARYSLRTKRTPLIDVRLFGRRSFGLTSIVTLVSGFSSYAGMFLLPMFYQVARGHSASTTGLLLIPQGLGTIAFLLIAGRLSKLADARFIIAGGVILTMIGTLPFAVAGASGYDALLLAGQFVRGVGLGASMQPIMALAFSGLSRAEIPRASAAFSVVQRIGAPFGVTVVAVLLQGYLSRAGTTGGQVAMAFSSTFWWILGFSAVPLLLSFILPSTAHSQPAAAPVERGSITRRSGGSVRSTWWSPGRSRSSAGRVCAAPLSPVRCSSTTSPAHRVDSAHAQPGRALGRRPPGRPGAR